MRRFILPRGCWGLRLVAHAAPAAILVGHALVAGGCVELGLVPRPDDGDGITDGTGGGNGGDVAPRVRLTVSNTTPQPNEEVELRCRVTNDAVGDITFDFQAAGAATGRLQVDETRGVARLIVQETDVGVAVTFTCTATSELGTSPPSNQVVVVATPAQEPP